MEASKVAECPDERQDLCDDNLQQPAPAPQDNLADQLTSDIQKDPAPPPKAKRPRSKAQQEAFAKAQRALKEKRAQKAKQSPVKSKPKSKAKIEIFLLICKNFSPTMVPWPTP